MGGLRYGALCQRTVRGCSYYIFGFLFLVFVILIITCAEITIVMCYFQVPVRACVRACVCVRACRVRTLNPDSSFTTTTPC
jgi:hypothetical protein